MNFESLHFGRISVVFRQFLSVCRLGGKGIAAFILGMAVVAFVDDASGVANVARAALLPAIDAGEADGE